MQKVLSSKTIGSMENFSSHDITKCCVVYYNGCTNLQQTRSKVAWKTEGSLKISNGRKTKEVERISNGWKWTPCLVSSVYE